MPASRPRPGPTESLDIVPERLLAVAAEAHYPLLVPLAVENPQPLSLEVEILHGGADQLADPHACVEKSEDDRPVARGNDTVEPSGGKGPKLSEAEG